MVFMLFAVAILKFLVIYKQGILHFHFAVDFTNYIASPTHRKISRFLLQNKLVDGGLEEIIQADLCRPLQT